MSRHSRIFAGLLLLSITTIEFGGVFLFRLLTGAEALPAGDSPTQFAFFRAGHAHAGVLVILALVSMPYIDQTPYGVRMQLAIRILISAAPLLVSGGFFGGGAAMNGLTPGPLVALLFVGAACLAAALLLLGVGLLRTSRATPSAASAG